MGTSGTPWVCDRNIIVENLKKSKGRITHAAKMLNVHYDTLKKRINADAELTQLLVDLRNELNDTMLDAAENTLMYALSQKEIDLANAIRSSFFILNNKGAERGYSASNNPNNQGGITLDDLKLLSKYIDNSEEIPQLEEADVSELETKQPLLDQEPQENT